MATGRGATLEEALRDALRAAGWQRSRGVKSWHARLSALTNTSRGQHALIEAGLEPGERARYWRRWLSQEREPSKANRSKIDQAYAAWRHPQWVRTGRSAITGEIQTEQGGTRLRGISEAPLRVEHRCASPTRRDQIWGRIEAAYDDGDDDALYDAYVDVIDDDLGLSEFETGSGGYTVVIT